MSVAVPLQPLGNDECLARFVIRKDWVRQDQTLRPEAFIPHPHDDLSVSRHQSRPDCELWEEGKAVAAAVALSASRPMQLLGRGDFIAADAMAQKLRVEPDPLPAAPHHAVVLGWPSAKAEQKIKALILAAAARFVPYTA
jgi:hypothetical protein